MSDHLRRRLGNLPMRDEPSASAVRKRAEQILRPPGALQRLDDIAVQMAGWQVTTSPTVRHAEVIVFAADHGVVAGGVSNYPSEITAAMLAAVNAGVATINAFAEVVGARVTAHDVGVGHPTGDIRSEPAMSSQRFDEVVDRGIVAVDETAARGADLIVLGELGIGNTTAAAAVAAALLGGDVDDWVGRGAGVDDSGLERKRRAVAEAVGRIGAIDDPLTVLREAGGAELVAMAAACMRARELRVPVVLDGFLAGAAVLPLHEAAPGALDHCIAGHRSAEPGHGRILDHLGLVPLLELDMRLGEGSGAVAAIPLVRLACAGVVDVPTFDEFFQAAPE